MRAYLLLPLLLLAACGRDKDRAEAVDFEPPTNMSRADYSALLDSRFFRLDVNGDGVIERSEFRRPERLDELDGDTDGNVTRAEFLNGNLARFDKADVNHDGIMSSAERDASGLFGRRRPKATTTTAPKG